MVDFSFIVSLYVSDLLNVIISSVPVPYLYSSEAEMPNAIRVQYEYRTGYG